MARVLDDIAASAERAWSWSAILKGTFAALAAYVVLRYFGAALGVSTGDRVLDAGFAVWSVFAQIIAIGLGAVVTGLALGRSKPLDAAAAGMFTWAVSIVLMTTLLGVAGPQAVSSALWGAFLGAVLSAGAGVAGGLLGVQMRRPSRSSTQVIEPPDQSG